MPFPSQTNFSVFEPPPTSCVRDFLSIFETNQYLRVEICDNYPGRFQNEASVWMIKTAKLYMADSEENDSSIMCCFYSYHSCPFLFQWGGTWIRHGAIPLFSGLGIGASALLVLVGCWLPFLASISGSLSLSLLSQIGSHGFAISVKVENIQIANYRRIN